VLAGARAPERALELYGRAIEALEDTPGRPLADAWSARGELLELLGRHDEAYASFKTAAQLTSRL
jgi:tetratricopeptide (TPR) repeat protein